MNRSPEVVKPVLIELGGLCDLETGEAAAVYESILETIRKEQAQKE